MSDLFNEDDVATLEYTKKLRKEALKELTENGPVPGQRNNRVFIDLLDGLDRQILAKASVKTQDEGNKSSAAMAAQLLMSLRTNKDKHPTRKEPPRLSKTPDANDVPGELDVDPGDLTLDEILK